MEWKLIIELKTERSGDPVLLCTRDGAISLGWMSTEGDVLILDGKLILTCVFYADMCKMYHKYLLIGLPEEVMQNALVTPSVIV